MALREGPETGGNPSGVPPLALFVCHANVCRSPLAHGLVEAHATDLDPATPWRFLSAGTAAQQGEDLCPTVARALDANPGSAHLARVHSARPLTAQLVEAAAVVLTASVHERSAVARLSPAARSRSFTLLEAAMLAQVGGLTSAERASGRPASQLAPMLHTARGLTSGVQTRRGPWWSGSRGNPRIDVPDVHQGEARHHRSVVGDIERAAALLGPLFAQFSLHATPAEH